MVHVVQVRTDAVRNRARIRAAARDLVAAQGPEVSMDAIAERAGVAVGTLYRHYPTKADLVAAVIEETFESLADLARASATRVEAGADPDAEVVALFLTFAERLAGDKAIKAASSMLGRPVPTDPEDVVQAEPGTPIARGVEAVQVVLDAAIKRGALRPDLTIADLVMLLEGVPDGENSAPARQRYVDIVLSGVRPRA